MKLLKFKAKNFKNLINTEIDFSNYNLISGDNGSGKSSILQGVAYCLTDRLPEKLSEYIRWGENSFELVLDFEHNTDLYSYSVKYTNSSKKELRVNDKDFFRGADAVNQISKLVNADLLLYSSISEQGQSYSILMESPAERLKKFKTILGIDKLTRIVEETKKEISVKRLEADSLKKEVDFLSSREFVLLEEFDLPDISEVKKSIAIQETYKVINSKNQSLRSKYELDLSQYDKDLALLDSLKKEFKDKSLKLSSLMTETFNESRYNDLLLIKKQYEFDRAEYLNKKSNWENYETTKKQLLNKRDLVNGKKSAIKLYRVSSLDFDDLYLKELNERILDRSFSLKTLKNHERLAKDGKCSTCGQDFKHDIKSILSDINDLESEISTLKDEYQTKKSIWDESQKKNQENLKNKEIIQLYENELESILKEIEFLVEVPIPKEIEFDSAFLSELETLEKQKVTYEKVKDSVLQLNKETDNLKFQIDRLSDLKIPKEPIYETDLFNETVYESFKRDLNVYEEKASRLKFIQDHNEKIKQEEESNKNLIKNKETVYYSIMGEISVLEESKNIIDKQFSSYLIEKGTEYVEFKMNSFFQKCYSRYTVYFRQTESKNSIDFYYTDKNGKGGSASLCSGFEKQLLSIAFRVALASITGIGFLILDEIDSDASEDNSISLYSNLIDSNLFSQIICISHKNDTKEHLLNNYQTKLIELGDVSV
jgi:DNA repair exonuclease SbcCD ATPase subunit